MVSRKSGQGRLIALEGTSGPDLAATAQRLQRLYSRNLESGISSWDASNIFYDISRGQESSPGPSPRTLVLLYAADLAFRLRWEIAPALEEGMWVIAAPYVESALAFGQAAGVRESWMEDLFRFAPQPQVRYRIPEKKDSPAKRAKTKPLDPDKGFLEFCSIVLEARSSRWNRAALRKKSIAYLDALERRRKCQAITRQILRQGGK